MTTGEASRSGRDTTSAEMRGTIAGHAGRWACLAVSTERDTNETFGIIGDIQQGSGRPELHVSGTVSFMVDAPEDGADGVWQLPTDDMDIQRGGTEELPQFSWRTTGPAWEVGALSVIGDLPPDAAHNSPSPFSF